MYHSASSSSGNTDGSFFPPCPPAADAFLVGAGGAFVQPPMMPGSCYGLLHQQQQHRLSPPSPQAIPGASTPAFRRVLSAGDLAAPAPAGRYSAEERRERIDKYRSKRNQRNFQKKITYACRKTLADSRPRVKGRFARNGDGDGDGGDEGDLLLLQQADEESSSSPAGLGVGGSGATTSAAGGVPEWWPAMQEALAREEDDDQDLLAAYLGVSSINLCSYESPRGH